MIRILHCSDIHLEISFVDSGLPSAIGTKLRSELRSTLGSILSEARRLNVDAVTIAGDLYEQTNCVPETARFLVQQFERMGSTRVLISPGERDPYGPRSLYAQTRWPDNVHVFSQAALEAVALSESVTIWGGACPVATQDSWRGQIKRNRHTANIFLAHATVSPETRPSLYEVSEDELNLAQVSAALLGGKHRPELPNGASRIVYPGSPQPLSWNDPPCARGAVLITVEGDNVTATQINLPTWHFVEVEVNLDGCESVEKAAKYVDDTIARHLVTDSQMVVYRVSLTGEPLGDFSLAKIHDQLMCEVDVLLRRQFTFAHDLDELAREQTVRGVLARRALEAIEQSPDKESADKILASVRIALMALEGKQVSPDAFR